MIDKNLLIFGYPRSGTKLISTILSRKGYFVLGEFFDTWTSQTDNNGAERLSPDQILRVRSYFNIHHLSLDYIHAMELSRRIRMWKDRVSDKDKWAVTVWLENLSVMPTLITHFGNCKWLCPRRDTWDQLISYLVVQANSNPDGNKKSLPITVGETLFHRQYWRLHTVLLLQDELINSGLGYRIEFDQLISGKCELFGENYIVETNDQHLNPEDFVLNIDDVREWFHQHEKTRNEQPFPFLNTIINETQS